MNWITINEEDKEKTYPKEGIDVLVSDTKNYDVAWYLMSSEYVWMKTDILNDTVNEFKEFKIIKWSYIK